MNALYIILGLAAIIIIWAIGIYNKLVALRENRENAFADIDVQLKQRHDLIPQLINTVKWAKDFEEKVLTKVTEARASAMWARSVNDKIKSETALAWALSGFFAVAESYPDIKSNQNFLQLQWEVSDIENKLAASRRFFNSATKELNVQVQTFPAIVIANSFGFGQEIFFEIDENKREELEKAPEIKFD